MADEDLFAPITDEDLDSITIADDDVESNSSSDALKDSDIIRFFMTMRLSEHFKQDLTSDIVNTVTVDILNELTNGKVTQQVTWKRTERELYFCYFMVTVLEDIIKEVKDPDTQTQQNNKLYASAYLELLRFRINQLEGFYLELCEQLKKEPQLENLKEGSKIKTSSEYEVSSSPLLSMIYESEKSDT